MVGPGFRGATRLAASSVTMMVDTITTNRENILRAVAEFHAQLDQIEFAIRAPASERLAEILQNSSDARGVNSSLTSLPEYPYEADRVPRSAAERRSQLSGR